MKASIKQKSGSVEERVCEEEAMEGEPTRIMLAVNQSTIKGYPHASISSSRAFEWTLQKIVRNNASGFKLLFLHVLVPDEDGFDEVDSVFASPGDFENLKQRDNAKGLRLLEFFVNRCHEIGVACEAWLKKGNPTEVISHETKRMQPDFLVVGSRGLGTFKRVFVGTVSEFCAKHAACPVITVKRREDEMPEDSVDD